MSSPSLKRALKTPGAIMMGLGSIVGTGLFVSIALATQITGTWVILAILIAAVVATLNGLSSAQLAANHPVSGGTYEYGYRQLNSWLGFTAGFMFMTAKSASAATAALGCAAYLLYAFDIELAKPGFIALSLGILLLLTLLVSGGIRRSNQANTLIVGFTIFGLIVLVGSSFFLRGAPVQGLQVMFSGEGFDLSSLLHASALMFVAYTGYGRIATLGEEVAEPRRTIPKAIILCMLVIVLLYSAVALTAFQVMDAESFAAAARANSEGAPLIEVARSLGLSWLGLLVSAAAVTAMAGVLLNLLLGLSRVLLSMARRRDIPAGVGYINPKTQSPVAAVWVTAGIIGALVLSGDIRFTWSFSAFTVLIYYAITNASAFTLSKEQRLYPRAIPAGGFIGCLGLAFWIEPQIWALGLGFIAAGLLWHGIAQKVAKS
ncbi:MAG: APC family permease [Cyclonatronaceae bacterium]